ncbi:MAG: hypothetical protein ACQESE_01650 [Nanobdellota archaeon]
MGVEETIYSYKEKEFDYFYELIEGVPEQVSLTAEGGLDYNGQRIYVTEVSVNKQKAAIVRGFINSEKSDHDSGQKEYLLQKIPVREESAIAQYLTSVKNIPAPENVYFGSPNLN